MVSMPNIAPLTMVVLPLLGAGALLLIGEGYRYRTRDPLPALIAGAVFAASLLLSERAPTQEVIPWPSVQVFGSRPAILVDQFALPFVFGLVLVAIAATIVGDNLSGRNWAMALLLWGGSLCIVISANPLTLLLSWVLCEIALIGASLLSREPRLLVYRLVAGGAGAVVLLLLARQAGSHPMVDLQTALAGLTPRWIAAFFAVGAIRMGLYPLHLAGFGQTDAPLVPLVLGRLATAVAGLYLWFRGFTIINSLPSHMEYLVAVGGLAVLVSAFAAWGARSERSLLPWLVGFELGVMVVALSFADPQLTMLAALEMLNLLLAGGIFGLSLYAIGSVDGRRTRGWVRGLAFLATASLLGLPPTPGFVARWGLYRQTIEAGDVAAILPIAVASGLLVPSLFAALRPTHRRPVGGRSNHAIVGLTILGLPLVLVSAQPLLLAPVLDAVTNGPSYPVLAHLIRGASSRMSGQIIALIVIPVLAGYSLDHIHARWRAHGELDSLWRFLSLDWLYDLLASTVLRAAIAVSILLTFLELGSALGWAVVASLLLVLLVLRR